MNKLNAYIKNGRKRRKEGVTDRGPTELVPGLAMNVNEMCQGGKSPCNLRLTDILYELNFWVSFISVVAIFSFESKLHLDVWLWKLFQFFST